LVNRLNKEIIMLFAKIENDTVTKFPVSEKELRAELSSKVLPLLISQADLEGTGYVPVPPGIVEETPAQTKDKRLVLGGITKQPDGTWRRYYELEDVPADIAAGRLEGKWDEIRKKRNELMAAIDWRVARYNRQVRLNLTPTDNITVLDTYMQTLADITNQPDPYFITFPEIPA
jgi:hypothetical protein